MTTDRATPPLDADVLIVGAGPAGLALAAALADLGLAPMLLEQQPLSALEQPAEDGRDIAITHRSRQLMQDLGLWQRLPAGQMAPLREARVLDGHDRHSRLGFRSAEADALGWLLPNHCIRAAALAAARSRPSVVLRCEARVTGFERGAGHAALSVAGPDGRSERLRAALVVAADSRFSQLRRLAGIGAAMRDFGRSVIVGRIQHERDHQGIAWECFRYGHTLALLPMNGGQCSAVVTVASDQVDDWLGLDDAAFAARIQAQAGPLLGAVRAAGPRHHYPLVGVYAQRFATSRCALVGDAAVGMHPVTAHGWNFGLYGIARLAAELQALLRQGRSLHDGPALDAALQRYAAAHRRQTLPVYLGTNLVVSLFTDERGPARQARRALLDIVERVPPVAALVKSAIVGQLTGRGGIGGIGSARLR